MPLSLDGSSHIDVKHYSGQAPTTLVKKDGVYRVQDIRALSNLFYIYLEILSNYLMFII